MACIVEVRAKRRYASVLKEYIVGLLGSSTETRLSVHSSLDSKYLQEPDFYDEDVINEN